MFECSCDSSTEVPSMLDVGVWAVGEGEDEWRSAAFECSPACSCFDSTGRPSFFRFHAGTKPLGATGGWEDGGAVSAEGVSEVSGVSEGGCPIFFRLQGGIDSATGAG